MSKDNPIKELPFFVRIRVWLAVAIAHIGLYVAHKIGWYRFWSRLYQRVWHKRYMKGGTKESLVDTGLTPVAAQNLMNLISWRADKFRELFDAFGAPEWFQYNLNIIKAGGKQKPGAMDCDEYAIWAANSVDKEYKPEILSVSWVQVGVNSKGRYFVKLTGHNVCAVSQYENGIQKFFHIGNWRRSSNFVTRDKLVKDVWSRGSRNTKYSRCLGYAFYDKGLSIKSYHKANNDWVKHEK